MLTDAERSLVRKSFQQGPSVFVEEGFTAESIDAFLKRDDVRVEWDLLQQEFNHQEALNARTKFVAKRQLARLTPGAVAVLGQALAGASYARDPATGAILRDAQGNYLVTQPEPTSNQVRAAEAVLEFVGVDGNKKVDTSGDESARRLFRPDTAAKLVTIEHDKGLLNEAERGLSREKVRNAMEALLPALVEGRKQLVAALKGKKTKRPPKSPVNTVSTPKG